MFLFDLEVKVKNSESSKQVDLTQNPHLPFVQFPVTHIALFIKVWAILWVCIKWCQELFVYNKQNLDALYFGGNSTAQWKFFSLQKNKFKLQEIVIKLKFDDNKGHHVPAFGYLYSLRYPLTTQTL